VELIDSCGQLLSTDPTLRCYIVGDGPDRSTLVAAIARNNAARQIILVPSCPTEQVALWMSAADLVTLPSYKEGCPNVVVEGLASGRPIVATNVGGIPELVDSSCGRLVSPHDVHALTLALDETLRQPWDAAAIAAAHDKSWKDVSDNLYGMLAEALHSSPQEVATGDPVLQT
jgi:teichuronic acid biosynthesis glycosyltransferase TuaC